tara:strand:+ start:4019 stop:4207 length:189 start_codon:yes stop_codon:yes gene_type:complete
MPQPAHREMGGRGETLSCQSPPVMQSMQFLVLQNIVCLMLVAIALNASMTGFVADIYWVYAL